MKRVQYTPDIGKYLRANYKKRTIAELSRTLGCGKSTVSRWALNLGLAGKKKAGRPWGQSDYSPVEEQKPVDTKHIQRPPAQYSNTSREQHIERWLNVAI